MAGRLGDHAGGSLGLLSLCAQHQEAVEFDLLALGRRWDELGDTLSLRDLWVIVRMAPRTSALARAIHGDAATWGPAEHLLAAAVDALNGANWQRSGVGPKPRPVERPRRADDVTRTTYGAGALPIDELNEWLAQRTEVA